MNIKKSAALIFLILLIDQIVKFWIKTHFFYGEEVSIFGNWLLLHFTENNGMAFGFEFGGSIGKFLLTFFRILLVIGIAWYLHYLIKHKEPTGVIVCFCLIFAGAIGNIVDSVFYGHFFSQSNMVTKAAFMPAEGGYAPLFHGRVVDMIYFHAFWPEWMPLVGGTEVFPNIFNVADSSITIGVLSLILFNRKFFNTENKKAEIINAESAL